MAEKLGSVDTGPQGEASQEEVHLLDLLVILGRNKLIVFGAPILCGLAAMAISLLMTPVFSSTAKIMPPQPQQNAGMAAMLGQLGGMAGAASGIVGLKNPNDMYIGLLESRTVADNLVSRLKLKERYEKETFDDTRRKLAANSVIGDGKNNGFITITAVDKDPQFAADLANAYVDELSKLTQSIALTEASQRRLFFEKQLQQARDELARAELALRGTQEKTGLVRPDAQVQAIITTVAQLKGSIAAKEVQLNAMRTFATSQNPDLRRLEEELRSMRAQLVRLELSSAGGGGNFNVPVGKIPEVGVEYVRAVRNVKYHETIFELLAKQFELAKIDEAKNSPVIQLLDKAMPAERKSKPSRMIITLIGAFAGLLLGIILAALLESGRNPGTSERWRKVRAAWRNGRSAMA